MSNDRLLLLDLFRGLAVIVMIIVDAPPDFDVIYPILKHSAWEGLTIADFAFPMFVFAMGMSTALSKNFNPKKILRRAIILFILGVFFNVFPELLNYFMFNVEFADDIRILGVLQRLALTYLLGVFTCYMLQSNKKIFIAAFFLMILSSLNAHIYSPTTPFEVMSNINRAIDLEVLGESHLYQFYGFPFDPENLYGTINSVASVLFGFIACRLMISKIFLDDELRVFSLFGITLLIVGILWSYVDIISKPLWTAPYVLITSGISYLLLAIFSWLLKTFNATKIIFQPLCTFGMNPLFFYIATNFALIFLWTMPFEEIPLYLWIWQHTIQNVINPAFSATLFTLLWCVLWLPLAEFLYKRNIIIKI